MERFVARQPVFNPDETVWAYELLFRHENNAAHSTENGSNATRRVILNSLLVMGLDNLTNGKRAFINAPRETLLSGDLNVLPPDRVIIEVLETVDPDREVVAAIRALKEQGFVIALDDFVDRDGMEELVALADIIKVDFMQSDAQQRASMERKYRRRVKLLAEKVETREEFESAKKRGYSLFQGYFFSKPSIVTSREIKGIQVNYMELVAAIHQPNLDYAKLEDILRRDVGISLKLLRYINSAYFGLKNSVSSIRQALTLLGEKEIKKWLTLLAMMEMTSENPEELFVQAASRAKFCEDLAAESGLRQRQPECFLTGMFSVMEALLGRKIDDILNELPIDDQIKDALRGRENDIRRRLDCVLAYEEGDWKNFLQISEEFSIEEDKLANMYVRSIVWGDEFVTAASKM